MGWVAALSGTHREPGNQHVADRASDCLRAITYVRTPPQPVPPPPTALLHIAPQSCAAVPTPRGGMPFPLRRAAFWRGMMGKGVASILTYPYQVRQPPSYQRVSSCSGDSHAQWHTRRPHDGVTLLHTHALQLAKILLQSPRGEGRCYHGTWDCLLGCWAAGGFGGLYSGAFPQCAPHCPCLAAHYAI